MAIIYLNPILLLSSSGLPEDYQSEQLCFPLKPKKNLPIWPCFGCGLPCLRCYHRSGGLLPRLFTFTRKLPGSTFSVALAVIIRFILKSPGVTRHPVLRSSDFPPSTGGRRQLPGLIYFIILINYKLKVDLFDRQFCQLQLSDKQQQYYINANIIIYLT